MVFGYAPAIFFRHIFFIALTAAGDLPVCMRTERQMADNALPLVKKTISSAGNIAQLIGFLFASVTAINFIMPSPKKRATDRAALVMRIFIWRLVCHSERAGRGHLLRRLRPRAAVSLAIPAGRLIAERIEQAGTALAFFTHHLPPSDMRLWCPGQIPSHGISLPHNLAPAAKRYTPLALASACLSAS